MEGRGSLDNASGHFHCAGTEIHRKPAGVCLTQNMKEEEAKCCRESIVIKNSGIFDEDKQERKALYQESPKESWLFKIHL